MCGFVLWGYPASPFEGYAAITPWGQFIGALIMFFVLGFLPGLIAAKILKATGLLRISREVELAGLDLTLGVENEEAAVELEKALDAEVRN